ncbi:MAG TPA: sigma 54-interacting transcriptional regulator [Bacteroidota bacterium]|nr:sigma 54-interacting transcriptional regulator [Bacteroidota bacterium]
MSAGGSSDLIGTILDINTTLLGSAGAEELFTRVAEILPSILPFRRTAAYRYDEPSGLMRRFGSNASGVMPSLSSFPLRGSHIEEAASANRPTLIPSDSPGLPRGASAELLGAGVASILVLPLVAERKLIGSFNIGRAETTALSADQENLLERLGGQIALGLRNVLHVEALEKHRQEQARLISITNALVAEVEPGTLFAAVAEHLRALYPVRGVGIAFYAEDADAFERGMVMTDAGMLQSIEPIPRRGTLLERICSEGRPAVLRGDEIQAALDRFVSLRDAAAGEGGVSAVIMPMYNRSRRILAVAAAVAGAERAFGPDDLPFLGQLAVQIGLALENMQSYREIKLLRTRLEQEDRYLKEEINDAFNVSGLIYASAAIGRVMHAVEKAAATDATVLLMGETGTGKELFARTIHAMSPLASRALVKVNCAAIPSGLMESHLFGHERGAFTGAVNQHIGVFEVADGGTLFLDEIGELPPEMQVKLLRVLQEKEITRVGGSRSLPIRVRVIAATNRVIEKMVDEGTFRADLYYRLAVVPVVVPPLRERPEDIPLLATYFLTKYAHRFKKPLQRISAEAMTDLRNYSFPGNVRELENLVERAVVLCDTPSVGPEYFHLSRPHRGSTPAPADPPPLVEAGRPSGHPSERELILGILRESNWIIEGPRGAARRLGLKPSTLRTRMLKLGIQRDH